MFCIKIIIHNKDFSGNYVHETTLMRNSQWERVKHLKLQDHWLKSQTAHHAIPVHCTVCDLCVDIQYVEASQKIRDTGWWLEKNDSRPFVWKHLRIYIRIEKIFVKNCPKLKNNFYPFNTDLTSI